MLLILLLLVALCAAVYYYVFVPLTFWRKNEVKQKGLFASFLDTFVFLKKKSVADLVTTWYGEFPNTRYSGIYQFGNPVLILRNPDLIKQIWIKDFEHFTDRRTYIPEDLDPLFGKSIFSLKGERWKNMRSIVSPTFTSSKMKYMFVLIKECCDNFTNYFLTQGSHIQEVQFKDASGRFCTDVIASIAFGINLDSLDQKDNEFYAMVSRVSNLNKFSKLIRFMGFLLAPKLYRFLGLKLSDKEETSFFVNLVNDSIKQREEKGIVRPDTIQLLLETRKNEKPEEDATTEDTGFAAMEEVKIVREKLNIKLTDEDIQAQSFLFFFAGYESVSTMMCCMAHELAVNTDIQDRLRKEIVETDKNSSGKLTYDSLVRMKYLDMVTSEVLRKWPAQAGAERVCTKPYTIEPSTPEEAPLHLEKGHIVVIPTFGMHRDPDLFPNPDRFDPERFNDENKHKIIPGSYTPFGMGPRGCIASRLAILETKIFFYSVLLRLKIVPVGKTCIPLKLTKSPALIGVEDGCWLGLKRIE
uniref:Cytochrome P450 9e2-like n=1 Tax=Diabrotica virgifera virgifera TaxID=50390 RepID=A0A6P7H9V0_DIAVI